MLKLLPSVFGCRWPGRKRIATSKIEAKQKIDINGQGLFSLCELRLYLPVDVQRQCSEWIKLATTNFKIVWAKKSRNPLGVAPF